MADRTAVPTISEDGFEPVHDSGDDGLGISEAVRQEVTECVGNKYRARDALFWVKEKIMSVTGSVVSRRFGEDCRGGTDRDPLSEQLTETEELDLKLKDLREDEHRLVNERVRTHDAVTKLPYPQDQKEALERAFVAKEVAESAIVAADIYKQFVSLQFRPDANSIECIALNNAYVEAMHTARERLRVVYGVDTVEAIMTYVQLSAVNHGATSMINRLKEASGDERHRVEMTINRTLGLHFLATDGENVEEEIDRLRTGKITPAQFASKVGMRVIFQADKIGRNIPPEIFRLLRTNRLAGLEKMMQSV